MSHILWAAPHRLQVPAAARCADFSAGLADAGLRAEPSPGCTLSATRHNGSSSCVQPACWPPVAGLDRVPVCSTSSLWRPALQGLRTLVLGQRVLSEQEWAEWDQRYQQAAGSLDDRDKKIAECMREIEVDIDLIGVTAIEDKLQDGVPAAIQSLLEAGMKVSSVLHRSTWACSACREGSDCGCQSLLEMSTSTSSLARFALCCSSCACISVCTEAGILAASVSGRSGSALASSSFSQGCVCQLVQLGLNICCRWHLSLFSMAPSLPTAAPAVPQVWVITGDKQETAINIAISCKLIRNPDSLLICNADTPAAARRRIEDLLGKVQAIARKGAPVQPAEPKPTLLQHLQRMSEGFVEDDRPNQQTRTTAATGELTLECGQGSSMLGSSPVACSMGGPLMQGQVRWTFYMWARSRGEALLLQVVPAE